jgi:cytochrome c-type biogenesis protein CcmH/NrfG
MGLVHATTPCVLLASSLLAGCQPPPAVSGPPASPAVAARSPAPMAQSHLVRIESTDVNGKTQDYQGVVIPGPSIVTTFSAVSSVREMTVRTPSGRKVTVVGVRGYSDDANIACLAVDDVKGELTAFELRSSPVTPDLALSAIPAMATPIAVASVDPEESTFGVGRTPEQSNRALAGAPLIDGEGKLAGVIVGLGRALEVELSSNPLSRASYLMAARPEAIAVVASGPLTSWDQWVKSRVAGLGQSTLARKVSRELFERGEYQAALESAVEAAALDPQNPTAWGVLGIIRMKLKDHEAAASDLEHACKLAPWQFSSWINLTKCHVALERYAAALESVDRARALRPEDALVLRLRGATLEQLRRYEEAAEMYRGSLRREKDRWTADRLKVLEDWLQEHEAPEHRSKLRF